MKCSDCRLWKTEKCRNNPDGKNLNYAETFACFDLDPDETSRRRKAEDASNQNEINQEQTIAVVDKSVELQMSRNKAIAIGVSCFLCGSIVAVISFLTMLTNDEFNHILTWLIIFFICLALAIVGFVFLCIAIARHMDYKFLKDKSKIQGNDGRDVSKE